MRVIDKELLEKLYINERKPMHVIASEFNVSTGTIFNLIHKYGIPARDKHDHPVSDKVRETWRKSEEGEEDGSYRKKRGKRFPKVAR